MNPALVLSFTYQENEAALHYHHSDGPYSVKKKVILPLEMGPGQILVSTSQNLLGDLHLLCPYSKLQVEIDGKLRESQNFISHCRLLTEFIEAVNQKIINFEGLKDKFSQYENIFFYTGEYVLPLQQISEQIQGSKNFKGKIINKTFRTGWDALAREWKRSDCMGLDEIIEFAMQNKVGKIITNNFYLADELFKQEKLLVLPIFKFLGIEVVQFDFDIYNDYGQNLRAIYTQPYDQRFSIEPNMFGIWDQKFGLKGIQSAMSAYYRGGFDSKKFKRLQPGFKVAVVSHARLVDLGAYFQFVFQVIDGLPEEGLIEEFQFWYYAFRRYILDLEAMNTQTREGFLNFLSEVYLHGISFLKYEIIDTISKFQKVEIFGDEKWGVLFPDLYMKKYLPDLEAQKLFESGSHLRLNLNSQFSYFEHNPVFEKALNGQTPFLSFPAIARVPELDGFRHIEYRDMKDLQNKVARIQEIWDEPELGTAIQNFSDFCNRSIEELGNRVSQKNSRTSLPTLYGIKCAESEQNFLKCYHERLPQLKLQFDRSLQDWLVNSKKPLINEASRYMTRPFFGRLLNILVEHKLIS